MKILTTLLCLLPLASFAGEITVRKDVSFLGEERKEKLDAYLPPASFARPVPAVVFIHGGSWSHGSKTQNAATCRTLAENGYAVFSIDYLLNEVIRDGQGKIVTTTKVAWPVNFLDCKTALRFVRKNAAEYGVDPGRIAVMGNSAGGHLAMLVAATQDSEEMNRGGLHTDVSNEVSAVINFYGRSVITQERHDRFAGETPEQTLANAAAASPQTYFTKSLPPFLIVQGDADEVVPVKFNRDLAAKLGELGVPHEYVELPGAGHAFGLQPKEKDLRPVVLSFLGKYLAKPAPAAAP